MTTDELLQKAATLGQEASKQTGVAFNPYPVSSTVKSDTLKPTTPYTITPPVTSTNASNNLSVGNEAAKNTIYEAPTQTPEQTPEKSTLQKIIDKISGIADVQSTEGDVRQKYMDEQKTADKLKVVNDLNNQITTKSDAYDKIAEKIRKNETGMNEAGVNAALMENDRNKNNELAHLRIQQSVALGDYNTAVQTVDDLVNAQFEPLKNELDTYKSLYTLTSNDMTDSEKLKAQEIYDTKQKELDNAFTLKRDALLHQYNLSESAAKSTAATSEDNQSLAQALVGGTLSPTDLAKRGKDYNAILALANQYSMQTTGKPFDIAKASIDYKYASNVATQNTLNYLVSLAGDGGNLQELENTSNLVDRTQFPALNKVSAWAKLQTGDPNIQAYYTTVTEVADQVAKILQGGGTGSGTSDAKLRQANDLFKSSFSKAQLSATINALRPLLANRANSMIGDNVYLSDYKDKLGNINNKQQTTLKSGDTGTLSSGIKFTIK